MPEFVDFGERKPRVASRWAGPTNVVFTLLVLALSAIYLLEPDWAYALTLWPAWMGLGLIFIFNLFRRGKGRFNAPMTLAAVSAALAVGLSDTPMQFLRWGEPRGDICVVSLNCAAGSAQAMWEVAAQKPDIVLLQERPSVEDIEALAQSLYGREAVIAYGPDAAIITRGKLLSMGEKTGMVSSNRAWAVVDTKLGRIGICSLRLSPPILRFNLLDGNSWKDCDIHKKRLTQELDELVENLPAERRNSDMPIILGGDMNTPPDRVIQGVLTEKLNLRDSFWFAGRAWGGTAVNEYPFIRIDQIWSHGVVPISTVAKTTQHSDHRMVVTHLDFLK